MRPALAFQIDLAHHQIGGRITARQVVCQDRAVGSGDEARERQADQDGALGA